MSDLNASTSLSSAPAATAPKASGLLSEYLSEDETAAELDISVRTLQRWHGLREGPPRTLIGRRIMYRKDAVKAWLRARERHDVRAA